MTDRDSHLIAVPHAPRSYSDGEDDDEGGEYEEAEDDEATAAQEEKKRRIVEEMKRDDPLPLFSTTSSRFAPTTAYFVPPGRTRHSPVVVAEDDGVTRRRFLQQSAIDFKQQPDEEQSASAQKRRGTSDANTPENGIPVFMWVSVIELALTFALIGTLVWDEYLAPQLYLPLGYGIVIIWHTICGVTRAPFIHPLCFVAVADLFVILLNSIRYAKGYADASTTTVFAIEIMLVAMLLILSVVRLFAAYSHSRTCCLRR